MYNVGDVLYTRETSYYQFAPIFRTYEVVRITPTGKLRLSDNSLIEPTNTKYKLLTYEVKKEIALWELKTIFIDFIRVIGQANSKAFKYITYNEIDKLVTSIIPLIDMVKNNRQHNTYLTNSLSENIVEKYNNAKEEYLKW